jgi:hypothetical protein
MVFLTGRQEFYQCRIKATLVKGAVRAILCCKTVGEFSMYIALDRKYFTQALVLAATTAASLSLFAGSAIAQEAEEIEEVIVTGTRIQRANQVQPNPVYGLDSEEIKSTGQLNMIDVVDDLPQLFSSQNGAQSNFFDSTDTGSGVDNTPGLSHSSICAASVPRGRWCWSTGGAM